MKLCLVFSTCLLAVLATVSAQSPIQSGDRIAIIGNTFADQLRIHGYLETRLLQHDPSLSVRNLGWAGDTLTRRARPTNFPSEISTLTEHKTDVIIACFGMGESFSGLAGLNEFRQDLNAFIASHRPKKYNGKSEVRLILVSPIACENLDKLTPNHRQRDLELAAYTAAMREVARITHVHFIDLYTPSRTRMSLQESPQLTTNGITLNAYGYWILSEPFFNQLVGGAATSWLIELDGKSLQGQANGVELIVPQRSRTALNFSVTEKAAPAPPPPDGAARSIPLAAQRDSLVVNNLKPGLYRLTVDGKEVAIASHDAWARGVAIDASPAHRKASELRNAINDKNMQFIYSWKALNQVHIVGERRSSPSGRALPAEVAGFKKLARQREKSLPTDFTPKTRKWQLTPVVTP